MLWQDIRQHYPEQWLLVEALDAHSEANKRIVNELTVVDSFSSSPDAFRRYTELHRQSPSREFYVLHTSREQIDITERTWHGIRSAAC